MDGWAVSTEQRRACLTQLVMVQKETIHRRDELIAAGCVPFTLTSLADGVRSTLARDDIWRAPKLAKNLDRALTGEEADRLQALTPYLVEYLDTYFCAWADTLAPERMRGAWRVAKPLAAVGEDEADRAGRHRRTGSRLQLATDDLRLGRRLLNATTDPDLTINGWRTSVRTRPRTSSASSAKAC